MATIKLTFLGTGTSQGVPVIGCECEVCRSQDQHDKRLRTSALIRSGDAQVLIDAGPDLRAQMLRSGVTRLDGVLLTHEHMDHLGGIDDLRAFNYRQQEAMSIYSNEATLLAIRRTFHYAFAAERYPGAPELRLVQVSGAFGLAGMVVEPFEVMHGSLPVLGFRIGGLAYITDAKTVSDVVVDRLRGIDTLVLNALRQSPHPTHLNLTEAIKVVERIRPRAAWFTHISHLLGKHTEIQNQLPQGMGLAFDGLTVEVPA